MIKLIKYELIHSYRTYTLAFLIYIILSIVVPITFHTGYEITSIFLIGFVFLAIIMFCTLFIGIIYQYYKSMFSKCGYLTLTLPFNTHELIVSKIIATLIWFIIAMAVFLLGVVLFGAIISGVNLLDISINMSDIDELFSLTVLKNIISFVISVLYTITSLFVVVTLVHTKFFRKRRLLWGISIYIVMSLIIDYLFSLGSFSLYSNFDFMNGIIYKQETSPMIVTIVNLLFIGIFYFTTVYLIDHQIELD